MKFEAFRRPSEPTLLRNPEKANGLLRAKGIVILDKGHHLTSHLTDIKKYCIYERTDKKNVIQVKV